MGRALSAWADWRNIALLLVISILIFFAISIVADVGRTVEAFSDLNIGYVPLILAFSVLNYLIRLVRWNYYLRRIDVHLRRSTSTMVFFSGLTMSITPGKVGEIFKSNLLRELKRVPLSRSIPVVLAERITDVFSLVILALLGIRLILPILLPLLPWALLICVGVAIGVAKRGWLVEKFKRLRRFRRYQQHLEDSKRGFSQLLDLRGWLTATPLGVAAWLCEGVGLWLVLDGLGQEVDLLSSVVIYSVSTLVGAVAMVPGGLGVTEGSLAGLLSKGGVSGPVAAAATIVIRACTLWFAVALGGLALIVLHCRSITLRGYKREG